MLPSAKFFRFSLAAAGLLTVLLILVDEGISPSPVSLLLSNVLQAALVFWAAYCSFHVARDSRRYLRQLWVLFAAALFLGGAAKAIAAYFQNFAQVSRAAQWPSDVLSILWVAPTVMMFLAPSAEEAGETDWWQILDFAQIGVVALTAYLYFVYVPSLSEAHGPQMMYRMLVALLVRDIALGAGFLMRAAKTFQHSIRTFFQRMSYFFLAASAADLIYLLGFPTFPSTPSWRDIAWCAPYLYTVVFATTWKNGEEPVAQEMRSPIHVTIISRVFPACVPLLVLLMGRRIALEQMTIAWAIIGASFIVSAARLILTSERHRQIADHLLQAEKARMQSENMFSAAFRLSPDAMAINEVPGAQFLEINDSFTRMTGYTREEMIGRTALEMNLWVDTYHRASVMAKLREESEVREEEFYCRTKSGETRIFQFSGKIIEHGGRRLSLTLARDITARKKAEEALRTNEERFRSLIEDMHVGILLLGPDAEAMFVNQAALVMFGLRRDDALGSNISQTFIPIHEDGTKISSSMLPGARSIETRQTLHSQVVGWRRAESNDILWTLIDAIPQLTDQGEVASVILSITNISEMKKAEEALRKSEELFRTLVENLHVGIALIGAEQEIQFANQACLAIFGKKEGEIVGKKADDLGITPVNEDGTEMPFPMRPVARAIAAKQAVLHEEMGWRRTGSNDVLWLRGEVVPLFGENGALEKVITSFSDITKRKQAEEALRASEKRFRTLVEHLHVGIMLLGPDQKIQFANPASFKMLGMKEEQVLGKRTTDLGMTPVNEDGTEMPFSMRPTPRAIAARQAVSNAVFGLRRAESNDVLWLQGDAVPLFREDGELEMVILSHSDITNRKKAEEALRASEKLFRTLVENTHMAVVLLGPNQEIQFVNQATLTVLGMKKEEVLGKKVANLGLTAVNEDGTEMPYLMRPAPRAIATGQPVLNQVLGWRLAGSKDILWIQGGVVPLFGENGEMERLIASFTDVTNRKKAEEALRASEELFRTLVENLHVGISLIGPNQEILYANRASSKMFGLKERQSLGKRSIDLGMTPLDEYGMEIPASMRPVARAIATRQPVLNWVMGWRLPSLNDVLWIHGQAVPLFGKNGELKSVITAYSDITERKRAEESLRQLSTRLLQLQDEERRRVGRELHDVLAQSVMAVKLDLARLERSAVPLDKQAQHALSDARTMLGEMSRQIRTLSYTLHPPVLDELGLVSAIREFSTGFSERSGIALEVEVQAGFARLPQEVETALFRIVQECLSNIQRHSGSVAAKIRLRGGTEFVELQVSDRGRGMDQIKMDRGGKTGTRLGVGILGMRERMAQLGGKLEVESSSSGTTVRATLPLKDEVSRAASHSRGR